MMRWLVLLLIATSTPALSASQANPNVMNIDSVTILASSSVTVPITEISKLYSRTYNIDVNTVYNASGELLTDIKEGDPADIIITPSKFHLDEMKAEGLLDPSTITEIASNRLVLVASKHMQVEKAEHIEETLTNVRNKTLMIIGDPEMTSLGHATVDALKKMKLWLLFDKRVVPAATSTKAADYIIKGESAGIIYVSDAMLYKNDLNELGVIPPEMYEPVKYYAAVVVSGNMVKARKYLTYLKSKPAQGILKDDGFVVE